MGPGYLYTTPDGDTERIVRFTPILPANGTYRVSIRIPRHDQASAGSYVRIRHANGLATTTLVTDMTYDHWISVGEYEFAFGSSGHVEFSTKGADGVIVADAVRFERLAESVIVDNVDGRDLNVHGEWTPSSLAENIYGVNFLEVSADDPDTWIEYVPQIPERQWYEVFIRWPAREQAASNVPVCVTHAGGDYETTVDQTVAGEGWRPIGVFEFDPAKEQRIVISAEGADGPVAADAVKLAVIRQFVIDNADPGVEVLGDWAAETQPRAITGTDFLHDAGSDKGDASVCFNLTIPRGGYYDAFLTQLPIPQCATNVPVDVASVDGQATVTVNQQDTTRWACHVGHLRLGPDQPGSVTIRNDDTDGVVLVDGLILIPAPQAVVDNIAPLVQGYQGQWVIDDQLRERYGADYLLGVPQADQATTLTLVIPIQADGWYDVFVWTPKHPNLTSELPITIVHADGETITAVNQRANMQPWGKLGTFRFTTAAAGYLVFDAGNANGLVAVDAIGFSPAEPVPDGDADPTPEP